MREAKLRMSVPKGHLEEPTVRLLQNSGIGVVGRDGRQLFCRTHDPDLELVFVRAEDIPDFVAEGATDLGITGYDLVCESQKENEVVELLDLGYGRTRMVIASPEGSEISSPSDYRPGLRVATEFPNLTRRYFSQKGVEVEVVNLTGAAEIAPLIGVADLIVDVTSTGTTLRTHRLRVVDTILESTARLIANRRSLEEKGEKIEEIRTALKSATEAEGRKLILLNLPEDRLEEVKRILPGMAGPTVSRVEAKEPMLAVQAVVRESEVYKVVKELKKVGGRDILVLPIERVLP
ncbi:MAG: ATP phosphoribosyltransferase [Hadesarchaea archaeon]|nr:MAG: ATP phosphoribosyltransferase [Hadesarchaea archaeon]TDA34327.1 MAG: ATP phosphoribosyltransferase [Hadesarchaea archaeon]